MLGINVSFPAQSSVNNLQPVNSMKYALNEHIKPYTLPHKYFILFVQFSQNLNVFMLFKCLGIKFHEISLCLEILIVERRINIKVSRFNERQILRSALFWDLRSVE